MASLFCFVCENIWRLALGFVIVGLAKLTQAHSVNY